MIESWQIPILTSALDFLFDVGRALLADIRSRREQDADTQIQTAQPAQPSSPQVTGFLPRLSDEHSSMVNVISTKEQALESTVKEYAIKQREDELEHLIRLAETYRKNYHLASEKYAKWGNALVPPVVVHELRDSEQHLIETLVKLKATVEAILGKKIELDEFLTLQDK